MHGRREYYKHWLRCYAHGHWKLTLPAMIAVTIGLALFVQTWWVMPAAVLAALLVYRAAAVTYELHARVTAEATRVVQQHTQRCAEEIDNRQRAWQQSTAQLQLDVQVLREQVADLKRVERRALKLARQRLDDALRDCKHAFDDPGLTPNAVAVELHKARQKVAGVLKPEQSELFAELTSQYARLLKQDARTGGLTEEGLTREQVATLRRASVSPSVEWLRDTIQQLTPDDLAPTFRP